jgi:membrane protease YdiL (CAAX protease family)
MNVTNEPMRNRAHGKGPIIVYLASTFLFAWLLWGYWVVAMPAGGLLVSPAFIACAIIGGLAPSLGSVAASWAEAGSAGVRQLLATVRRTVEWRYVAIALIVVPASAVASSLLQWWTIGPLNWPDAALIGMALIWPFMAAMGEEFGWRGFLLPRFDRAWGLLPSAVVVGLIWGVWHLPADFVGLKGYGNLFWLAFLINGPIVLTGHSIIISWLWRRTGQSTLAAILYHWSITVSAMLAPTAGTDGVSGLAAAGIGAGLIWVVAGALLFFRRNDFDGPTGRGAGPPAVRQ